MNVYTGVFVVVLEREREDLLPWICQVTISRIYVPGAQLICGISYHIPGKIG